MNENEPSTPRARLPRFCWILALFSVPAALAAVSSMSEWSTGPRQDAMLTVVLRAVVPWYAWSLWTPLIIRFVRRVPVAEPPFGRTLGFHVAACAGVGAGFFVSVILAAALIDGRDAGVDVMRDAGRTVPPLLVASLILYAAVAAIVTSWDATRDLRERSEHSARVETQLARARLEILQARLQPHFLFNSLNAVTALIRTGDSERAVLMIGGLSELLREMLCAHREPVIPLADERRLLEHYLSIESERWGPRLRVSVDIDSSLEGLLVPTLILQPLVENAIKHGVARNSETCEVRVWAERTGDTLRLGVDNTRTDSTITDDEGFGLSNTRTRLAELYGESATLRLHTVGPMLTRVLVELPWRRIPDEVASLATA